MGIVYTFYSYNVKAKASAQTNQYQLVRDRTRETTNLLSINRAHGNRCPARVGAQAQTPRDRESVIPDRTPTLGASPFPRDWREFIVTGPSLLLATHRNREVG